MRRVAMAAVIGAALWAAWACGGDDDGGDSGTTAATTATGSSGGSTISAANVTKLRQSVEKDMRDHGAAAGCAWLAEKHGNSTGNVLKLAELPGEIGSDWASGTVGTLSEKPEVMFGTVYATKAARSDSKLAEKDGDGFVCLISEA